ncbi:hypothetical protein BDD12DRAFT_803538 [Trichophaea hybrida]|nr:hypothetical protein BDD12DRAFT_803538 [Trichophaea hybrida]
MTTATTKISDDSKTSALKAPLMKRPLVNRGGPRKPQNVLTHKATTTTNHRRDDQPQPQPQPQPPPIKRSAPQKNQKLDPAGYANLTSKPYEEPVRFQKLRLTHKATLAVKSASSKATGQHQPPAPQKRQMLGLAITMGEKQRQQQLQPQPKSDVGGIKSATAKISSKIVQQPQPQLSLMHKAALGVKSATTETVGGSIKSATMKISSNDAQKRLQPPPKGKRSGDEQLATGGRPQKRQKVDPKSGNTTRLDTAKPKPMLDTAKSKPKRRIVETARKRDAGKLEPGINQAQFRNIITHAIPPASPTTISTIPPTVLPTSTPPTLPIITPTTLAINIPLQAEETSIPNEVALSSCAAVPLTSFQRIYAQRCKEHFPPGVRGIMGLGLSWMLQNRREDNERAAIKAAAATAAAAVVGEKGRKLQ